jgi:hypothetical protein
MRFQERHLARELLADEHVVSIEPLNMQENPAPRGRRFVQS